MKGERMGFSFRKSIGLGNGLRLNLGSRGPSLSKRFGPLSLNSRGGGSIRLFKGLSYRFKR
jgi:hypothetical protein